MSHVAQLLPRGYFHTKNEMIAVNIVEEQTQSFLQTDRQTYRQAEGQGETNTPSQQLLCAEGIMS